MCTMALQSKTEWNGALPAFSHSKSGLSALPLKCVAVSCHKTIVLESSTTDVRTEQFCSSSCDGCEGNTR